MDKKITRKFIKNKNNNAIKHYISDSKGKLYLMCLMLRSGIQSKYGIPQVIPIFTADTTQPVYLLNKPGAGANPLIKPSDVVYENEIIGNDDYLPMDGKDEGEDDFLNKESEECLIKEYE